MESHGNILSMEVILSDMLLREITQATGRRTTGDRVRVWVKPRKAEMNGKGQVRELCWRQTQPDSWGTCWTWKEIRRLLWAKREMRMKGEKSYLLVVIHIGDLSAIPLLKGMRGLHWPVNVIDTIGFVTIPGKCKKSLFFFQIIQDKQRFHYTFKKFDSRISETMKDSNTRIVTF